MQISGIQQMGIGVPDEKGAFAWYLRHFGADVKMFQEAAEAPFMIPYTGGKVQSRSATLAINMKGGGGFEIWQYTSRNTEKATFDIRLGDLGLYICKLNCSNVNEAFKRHTEAGLNILGKMEVDPSGAPFYFIEDPYGNIFQIIDSENQFERTSHPVGGVFGSIIGVSDIDTSLKLYREVLGYDKIIYDTTDQFEDLAPLNGGEGKFRRILLGHSEARKGPFAPLLGATQIELVQAVDDYKARKIFENRFWGDAGFIHLCFDIRDMKALKAKCEANGFPFTVDSGDTFDMGEAGGHFTYIEDPDGTLIEFVETHKIPILKKLGWYLNLQKRAEEKSLSKWLLKALAFNRVKL